MLKCLLRALLIFPLSIACAQKKNVIDSLEKISRSQSDSALVKTYNELTWQYRTISRDTALFFGEKALELGLKIGFDKGVAQAYNDMGIIYFDQENFTRALDYYHKAFDIRQKQQDQKGMAALYNKIGIIYQKQGNFDLALDNQLKALALYETLQFKVGISYSLNNIGILHQNMGNYDEALAYHEKSIAIKKLLNDQYGLAQSYVNAGNTWLAKKNFTKAELYYLQADTISRALGDKEYLANTLNNLGGFYVKTGQLDKALQKVRESFAIRTQLKDQKGIVSCMANLGEIFTKTKQADSAEAILNKAIAIADSSIASRPDLPKLYRQLADVYESRGELARALAMEKKYSAANDSLYTDDLKANFASLQVKYETATKEQTIQKQQYELARKNFWMIALSALLVLVLALAFSSYKRYRLRQDKKLQQEIIRQQDIATKAIIAAEENERKRIAGDLHDGVGQMMSAAKMNLSGFESRIQFDSDKERAAFENIIALVDESCREVRNVSHNMMPNALLKNGLANAIKEFISKIDGSVLKVNLYTEGLNERLPDDTETVLYRVIQECVNNVIKHAGANELDINLIKDSDGISATIDDNGRGFNPADRQNQEGIGMKNMTTRIQYLKGTISFDSSPGKGTTVVIQVPV